MDIKKLSNAMGAFVPAEAKGMLIIKFTGDLTQEVIDHYIRNFIEAQKMVALSCVTVFVVCREDEDITIQHLTDDQLRDIGFQRIYSEFK